MYSNTDLGVSVITGMLFMQEYTGKRKRWPQSWFCSRWNQSRSSLRLSVGGVDYIRTRETSGGAVQPVREGSSGVFIQHGSCVSLYSPLHLLLCIFALRRPGSPAQGGLLLLTVWDIWCYSLWILHQHSSHLAHVISIQFTKMLFVLFQRT